MSGQLATNLVDRIKQLLGGGVQPATVALTLGCDASYITQLLGNEQFADEVRQLKLRALQKQQVRDDAWDEMEDTLLAQMKKLLPMMIRPEMVMRALELANKAKRRGLAPTEQTIVNNTIVNLNMPERHLVQFQKNSRNEVIDVDGRPLATLPSTVITKLASQLQDSTLPKEQEIVHQIPTSSESSQRAATDFGL